MRCEMGFAQIFLTRSEVHWIDPTAKPERELAKQFKQKAEDVENAGYQRFAVTLRELAEEYNREADRIIAEHKRENGTNNPDETEV